MTTKNMTLQQRRAQRVRKKLRGKHPRLHVMKTNQHIHVQIIDDAAEKTVASVSTASKEFRGSKRNKESAKKLGAKIAELALAQKIKEVVFDRGARKYHGILAEVADAARSGGLKF